MPASNYGVLMSALQSNGHSVVETITEGGLFVSLDGGALITPQQAVVQAFQILQAQGVAAAGPGH